MLPILRTTEHPESKKLARQNNQCSHENVHLHDFDSNNTLDEYLNCVPYPMNIQIVSAICTHAPAAARVRYEYVVIS